MTKNNYSLIVETENLGMAEVEDLINSLKSIEKQKNKNGALLEIILVAGTKIPSNIQEMIRSKFPWIKIHINTNIKEYSESKMEGAKVAKANTLIFADSDMVYQSNWLSNMIAAADKYSDSYVISGDTRLNSSDSYRFALNCIWMVQIVSDKINKPTPYRNFPLNNFVIKRELMLKLPLPKNLALYRNKIPLWQIQLENLGIKTLRAPKTRGFHAPPSKFMDWFYRMSIYGGDFVGQANYFVDNKNKIVYKDNLPGRIKKAIFLPIWKVEQFLLNSYKLTVEEPKRIKYLPLASVIALGSILLMITGGIISIFNSKLMFEKITAYENNHS